MAEILTRTYKYTGKSGWNVGESTVPLSSFAVSGDTRPVTQILSISASWYRRHNTSMTVTHTAQLVFGDGSTLKSASVSKRGDGDTFKISAAFSSMPSGALWDESAVKLRTLLNTKKDKVYWTATADKPMILTITYTSTEFKPSISAAKIYRADENGAALDKGTNLSFTATLSVQEAGTGGSGVFSIYKGDSPGAAAELVYQQSGIAGSTAGVVVSQVPIPGAVLERGEKKWFRMEFVYTANTESGTPSTESVSAALLVNHVFTNVHLAGVSTGGVRFGGYSTAAEDEPKFECDYPVYLYGGIAQIGSGAENPLFVVSSETISFGGDAIIPGHVTGGRTSIHLSAPVGKFMTNVNSVRVTALSGYIRNDGGYGMTSAAASSNYMGYAPSATIDRATNTVHIYIHRNSGTFYLTNNAALTYVPDVLTLVFE